ncbi:MAG: glycosyltransferase, partial [Bryobacteraceae bacterium]
MAALPEVLETGTAPPSIFGRHPFRPEVRGKFLFVGNQKLFIRGVTYGTFRPNDDGEQFPSVEMVRCDFELIAANGMNAVRTYTVPPRWLLDLAEENGLFVMVGLPWEQHITFLDEPGRAAGIERNVKASLKTCAGHPAVLCYSIGNEIPASIVRWHGRKAVERFLRQLYRAAKAEDPQGLVTYVNFPTTEYLQLPFLDFVSFNVYLESQDKLQSYLARLQTLAGDRPLVMAEVGLDSRRNGEREQAAALDWQVRMTFSAGCAGMFVFAWTDEWYRGGHEIEDWDFGLVTRDRRPKPALSAVTRAFTETPFSSDLPWPRISVVVCSYNGSRTIGETLEQLRHLHYPNYEVIVVDDGSTDATGTIANQPHVRLIRVKNGGLSRARNIGAQEATGEIVAYIDDDAYPDPHWLSYLASEFMADPSRAGVGGPNVPPPGDGPIAEAVANAPGGPIHVLLSDRDAEHIPGCNCAYRRDRLLSIGGFDPEFRTAGDDVDVCWRLLARGWTLGFSPAALVWHHRRNSLKAYWKQQKGYGKAEALLERKFPEKYNALGHATWIGRLYGKGLIHSIARSSRIYHGTWNSAAFQSLYHPGPATIHSLLQTPEWYFITLALAALSALSLVWTPLEIFVPVLIAVMVVQVLQSMVSAARATIHGSPSGVTRAKLYALTTLLYLIQPV